MLKFDPVDEYRKWAEKHPFHIAEPIFIHPEFYKWLERFMAENPIIIDNPITIAATGTTGATSQQHGGTRDGDSGRPVSGS